MQVMILDEDAALRTEVAAALAPEGFDVLSFGRIDPAKAAARERPIDLLVMGERVEGRLAHDVALLAEWRNPLCGAVILTDRDVVDTEELWELLPSLRAILGRRTGAGTLARVALSAAASGDGETAEARLARRWEEAGGDAGVEEEPEPAPSDARLPSFLRRAAPPTDAGPASEVVEDEAAEVEPDWSGPAFASIRRAAGGRRLHLG